LTFIPKICIKVLGRGFLLGILYLVLYGVKNVLYGVKREVSSNITVIVVDD
jgi:hypothetical protein